MIKKILMLLLIAMALMGYNNRVIIGSSHWSATDTNQVDSTGLVFNKNFEQQILMLMFRVHDSIPDAADTFVVILDAWLTDTLMTYTKTNLITDTHLVSADTLIGFDTISDWYIQMCDTFLFRMMTLNDTMGFEADSVLVTPYLNRIR